MKVLTSMLLILFGASVLYAQSEAGTQKSDGLEVVKFSWSKERIGWERDPFGGPIENFDEMRARSRNEKRLDDAKRGGGGAGADRVRREAKADAANLERQREKAPPRYVFFYKVRLKNNSAVPVTAVDWDYVFFERGTENELGRQQITSEEQIGPGKSKELIVILTSPPTHTISVTSLNKNERDQLSERIELVRVKYADGRVWEKP
jgi:hypothetical protein